jgi:anti-anti-sigma regulatory factor
MDDCTVNEVAPADQPETKVVTIGGSMTIPHGGKIKTALAKALESAKTVLLNLEQVTEMDIIGLQLICSAHRASIAQDKCLSVIRAGNEAIELTVQDAGFCRHIGCLEATKHTCVWAEREK